MMGSPTKGRAMDMTSKALLGLRTIIGRSLGRRRIWMRTQIIHSNIVIHSDVFPPIGLTSNTRA